MARVSVATDNFNRANGAIGANWTESGGGNDGLNISSNQVASANEGAYDNAMFWNANSFNNNQYSKCTLKTIGSGNYAGPIVRANASDFVNAQCREGDAPEVNLYWYNGGAYTNIATQTSFAWAADDVMILDAEGSDFSFFVDDVEIIGGTNSSAPASGACGLSMYTTTTRLDDWEGGNIIAGTSVKDIIGGFIPFAR